MLNLTRTNPDAGAPRERMHRRPDPVAGATATYVNHGTYNVYTCSRTVRVAGCRPSVAVGALSPLHSVTTGARRLKSRRASESGNRAEA